jgi:hypothetical protein
MSTLTHIRHRIEAVSNAYKRTLIGRVANLCSDQGAAYRRWRQDLAIYNSCEPLGSAYARLLDGHQPPVLRPDIQKALFGDVLVITENMTLVEAADIYRRAACGANP